MLLFTITSKADKLTAELCAVCMSNNRDKDNSWQESCEADRMDAKGDQNPPPLPPPRPALRCRRGPCPPSWLSARVSPSALLLLLDQKHSHFPSSLFTAPPYSSRSMPLNDAFNCNRGLPSFPASSGGSGSDGAPTLCALPIRGCRGGG